LCLTIDKIDIEKLKYGLVNLPQPLPQSLPLTKPLTKTLTSDEKDLKLLES